MSQVDSFSRRLAAEAVGSALLLACVVGSGVMAERLSQGNIAIALLANAIATGAGLVALILSFGAISGAHFNPVVTLAEVALGRFRWRDGVGYVVAQTLGACMGAVVAHVMFALPLISASTHVRAGTAQLVSEFVATFGLLVVVHGCSRTRPGAVPYAVGAYITAAYWFTASTSFANPAVTIARALTSTFSGIRLIDVPGFVVAQLFGAGVSTALSTWLLRDASFKQIDGAPDGRVQA